MPHMAVCLVSTDVYPQTFREVIRTDGETLEHKGSRQPRCLTQDTL